MKKVVSTKSEAAQAERNQGADLLYTPNEPIFKNTAHMFLNNGWSIWPQERDGRRMPSRINDKTLAWKPYQERHASEDELKLWCKEAPKANVACALGGASGHTWAVDIDCMDQLVSQRIKEIAFDILGVTPFVRVGREPKMALFYRYDEGGSPHTRSVKLAGQQDCGLEILGAGRAITMHGLHHVTGCWFSWHQGDANPLQHPPEMAPEVPAILVDRFIEAVEAEFPFEVSARMSGGQSGAGQVDWATVSSDGVVVPVTKLDSRLKDGRNAFLMKLATATVGRNGHMLLASTEDGTRVDAVQRVIAAVIGAFEEACEIDGRWAGGGLSIEATSKVEWAVEKLDAGEITPTKGRKEKANPAETIERLEESSGKPVVEVRVGELGVTVDEVERLMVQTQSGLYQRGGQLVRVVDAMSMTSGGLVSTRTIQEIGPNLLADLISRRMAFCRYDSRRDSLVSCDMPMMVAATLLERKGSWAFPMLSAVITAPTMRADGSLLDQPGYDARTGLLLELKVGDDYRIPENPTREDAAKALEVFSRLVAGFPFVNAWDRSGVLSCFLTASVRRSLSGAPLFGISATTPGTGKTMLADIAAIIASGTRAAVFGLGKDDTEGEKRVHAKLLVGDVVLAMDNIERPIGGEFMNSLMTSETMSCRILGRSEAPTVSTACLITATGNNLTILDDMARRAIVSILDAGVERPELREFSFDPVAEVLNNRAVYVRAALTILRAYHLARPTAGIKVASLGNFEAWTARVSEALVWLGLPDPAMTIEEARSKDPATASRRSVLTQWYEVLGDKRVTVKEVVDEACRRPMGGEWQHGEFREALLVVAGESGAINARRMGKWLAGIEGRIVGGLRLSKAGMRGGMQVWRVQDINSTIDDQDNDQAPELAKKAKRAPSPAEVQNGMRALLSSTEWRAKQEYALSDDQLKVLAQRDASIMFVEV